MRRLLAYVLCLLLASSLGLGAVVHAAEPITCLETSSGSAELILGHTNGDRDQVPADSEKGFPHHHGGCHGHHVGVPITADAVPNGITQTSEGTSWEQAHGAGLIGDPALRPPQA
jgi:hypothetical protein